MEANTLCNIEKASDKFMKETRASTTNAHTHTHMKYIKRKFDRSNVDKC